MIAGAVAALLSLTVISFGVWGLVYPAIVLVIAALAIEPMYWLRKRIPTQRVWTDGSVLGVDGAAEVIAHPRDPVPLSSIAAFTVYPIIGGTTGGATINGVSTSTRVHYTGIDLWLTDGTRRLWIFNRITGITVEHEVALARALDASPSRPLVRHPDRRRSAGTGR